MILFFSSFNYGSWDKTIGRGERINLISPTLSSFLEKSLGTTQQLRRILNHDHLVVPLVRGDNAPGSVKPSILWLLSTVRK